MPIINIKLTAPLPPRDKLDAIAQKITNIMVEDLGKAPERTVINFDEIKNEATYFGGVSVQAIKEGK